MRVKLLTEISAMVAGFWMDTYNGAESRLQPYIHIYIYYVYILPSYTNVAVSLLIDEPRVQYFITIILV